MKKIIYLNTEIKIGEMIMYEGLEIEVTQKLISDNPSIFETINEDTSLYFKCTNSRSLFTPNRVYKRIGHIEYPKGIILISDSGIECLIYNWKTLGSEGINNCFELTTKEEWNKQELLDEAKRRYPIGTVYKHFNSEYTINSPDMLTVSEVDHHFEGNNSFETSIWVKSEAYNGVVYADGKWAEILPLKFTTEDGVDIYGDMKTYMVHPNDDSDIHFSHSIWKGNSVGNGYKYFYHKENALAYIEKHKEKTLKDYENMLLRTNINSINAREVCWFYHTLKGKEPKLYYAKILQLIADDLNGDWEPDFNNERQKKWFIDTLGVKAHCSVNYGLVYFKSRELAEKSKGILGGKLDYLLN